MDVKNFRENIKFVLGIIIPTLMSVVITIIISPSPNQLLFKISKILLFAFLLFSFLWMGSEQVCECHWKVFIHKKRLLNSKIGIIQDARLDRETDKLMNSPEDWKKIFNKLGNTYSICFLDILNLKKIPDSLVAVINPYNSYYPEIDIGKKQSFNLIKKYVQNGGIFVNVCNFPFYHAWNPMVGKISTAEEIYGYHGIIKKYRFSDDGRQIQNNDEIYLTDPIYSPTPVLSLSDTLAFKELGLLTTSNSTRLRHIYQSPEDLQEFGDIIKIMENPFIYEFRATRKPSKNFKPMIRSKIYIKGNDFIEIYPISFIPHYKGKFLICGLMMDKNENENIIITGDTEKNIPSLKTTYNKIQEDQMRLVYKSLDVLIKREKTEFKFFYEKIIDIIVEFMKGNNINDK